MNEDGNLDWNFRGNFAYPLEWYGDCSGHSTHVGELDHATGYWIVDYSPDKLRDMRILGTDYDNYYIKWSCRNSDWAQMHWEGWAIFSREQTLSPDKLVEAQ